MSLRTILRLEGAVTLAAVTALFAASCGGALMFSLIRLPDVVMPGHLANRRAGAAFRNLGHVTVQPVAMAGDGLKHPGGFRRTPLGTA